MIRVEEGRKKGKRMVPLVPEVPSTGRVMHRRDDQPLLDEGRKRVCISPVVGGKIKTGCMSGGMDRGIGGSKLPLGRTPRPR